MKSIPEIKHYRGAQTLFVDDEPFLVLGGEIHNSSASNLDYLDQRVWPNLEGLNLNTVLIPIYWELIEQTEGVFDYSIIDGMIAQARRQHKRLILLWFGLWKNSESMYVPGWMKKDPQRYFRSQKVNGEAINTISPLCQAAVEKDAKALAHILAHIKSIDEGQNSVIAIQVENEIGLLGTDRDYSQPAEDEFRKAVPEEVGNAFGVHGPWNECFGEQAGEYFMAYHFARAVEFITCAAQKEYPLPCYANAWLEQYPWYLGSYPVGGPVASMHKIWRLMAPSLFCLAPDIYVPYVPQVMQEYTQNDNPLFIPEVRKDAVTASYALYAFGHYQAIGYSPFAIEDLSLNPDEIDKPPLDVMIALNIDPGAFDTAGSKDYLSAVYGLLENIRPLYFQHRCTAHLQCYLKQSETDYGSFLRFEKYDFLVAYAAKQPQKPLACGMIFEVDPDCFYIIGMMSTLKILPKPGQNKKVDILKLEEGDFIQGQWKPGRVLNGDEKMSLQIKDRLTCFYLEIFTY